MADISRIAAVQHACEVALSTASVMLITWNVLGGTLNAVPDFKSRLKDEITVLLEAQPVLDEQLALQIYEHLEAKVAEAIVVEQSAKVHGDLKVQIIALCSINHPLRKLLSKRYRNESANHLPMYASVICEAICRKSTENKMSKCWLQSKSEYCEIMWPVRIGTFSKYLSHIVHVSSD